MAFQAVPDVVEVSVIYTMNGVPVQNTFYAERAGGYDLADVESLIDSIDNNVGIGWLPDQAVEASYVRTEGRGLAKENDVFASNNDSAGPGSAASGALPGNVTLSIKKESGLTGRSARGRSYWIGPPRGELKAADENEFETAYVALVVANIDLIRSTITGLAGWQAVLVSRITNGAPRPFGETFDWLSTVAVDERVDTMRNRLG